MMAKDKILLSTNISTYPENLVKISQVYLAIISQLKRETSNITTVHVACTASTPSTLNEAINQS